MRLLAWMLILSISTFVYARDNSFEISKVPPNSIFKIASELFSQGKYQSTVEELKTIESGLAKKKT